MRPLKWLIAVPVLGLVLALGGTWAYINVLRDDVPARLTLEGGVVENPPGTTAVVTGDATVAPASFDGTWLATGGSQAGYRVDEVLFGQRAEAVGRTNQVDGALTISGTTVETAAISIDLASVESDESRRDSQFRDRIMDVGRYPTATFVLTEPINLESLPEDGDSVTVPATGELTIRGVKKTLTVDINAKRTGGVIAVNGTIPVVFADYGIPDPSFGPARVEDHGEIEFLVNFTKQV